MTTSGATTDRRQVLEQALPALGIDLHADQVMALLDYMDLIQKWTKVYNLTAVRDPAEMLTHHLLRISPCPCVCSTWVLALVCLAS